MQESSGKAPTPLVTLDAIKAEKERLRTELDNCYGRMKSHCQALYAPGPTGQSGAARWMGNIERALTIYDGVMFGMKVIRRLRKSRLFRRRR